MIPDEKEYKTRVTLTSLSAPMSSPTLGTHTLTNDQGPKIGPRINLTWRWIVQHSNPVCMEVCNGSQCGWKGVWYWARWCTLSSTQSWNHTWFSPVFGCSMNSCRDRIGIGIRLSPKFQQWGIVFGVFVLNLLQYILHLPPSCAKVC